MFWVGDLRVVDPTTQGRNALTYLLTNYLLQYRDRDVCTTYTCTSCTCTIMYTQKAQIFDAICVLAIICVCVDGVIVTPVHLRFASVVLLLIVLASIRKYSQKRNNNLLKNQHHIHVHEQGSAPQMHWCRPTGQSTHQQQGRRHQILIGGGGGAGHTLSSFFCAFRCFFVWGRGAPPPSQFFGGRPRPLPPVPTPLNKDLIVWPAVLSCRGDSRCSSKWPVWLALVADYAIIIPAQMAGMAEKLRNILPGKQEESTCYFSSYQ